MESNAESNKEAEKERQQCISQYSSSRQEVTQLLYLNEQLKIRVDQLEKKLIGESTEQKKDEDNR